MRKSKAPEIRRRKSRFISKQRHKASCGPIAVANLIKWHGIETSYLRVLQYCLQLRAHSPIWGMLPWQMNYVLKSIQVKFKVRRSFSVEAMDALISQGGAAILVYATSDKKHRLHCVFIEAKKDDGFRAWNRGPAFNSFFTREQLDAALKKSMQIKELYVYCFQPVKPIKK